MCVKNVLSHANLDALDKFATLHDFCELAVPGNILNKPTLLTEDEINIMKTHTTIGHDVIEASIRKLGKKFIFDNCVENGSSASREMGRSN